jgi:hypothetical protein
LAFLPRAIVLALHADGVPALLGAGDVVEEEDAFGAGERSSQRGAVAFEDFAFVMVDMIDEMSSLPHPVVSS